MKKLCILVILACLLVGCGKEETLRQLCQVSTTLDGETWWVPTWFDPATGELEPVCGEETHKEDCPFRGTSSRPSHVVGNTIYFAVENTEGADLTAYTPGKGTAYNPGVAKMETFWQIHGTTWRGKYLFKGDYLYIWDREEDGSYKDMKQIYLPDMRIDGMPENIAPWDIEGNTGFYLLGSYDEHYISGVYSQPLPDGKTTYRPKELLFHSKSFHEICLAPDAIYWQGYDGFWYDQNQVVPEHLYRYDRLTGDNTLLVENFGGGVPVAFGEYVYAVRHDGTRDVLMQVHGTTGTQKILYTTEEGASLNRYAPAVVGQYVVVDYVTERLEGKLVYDTVGGTYEIYEISPVK